MNNEHYTTTECDTCSEEIEVHKRFANDPVQCESCRDMDTFDALRECLDPEHDGVFDRPDALRRLANEFDALPLVDYDGSIVMEVDVQYGRGIGGEPNGRWVESIEKLVECPECGYGGARDHYKANAGHEPMSMTACPRCGFEENNV